MTVLEPGAMATDGVGRFRSILAVSLLEADDGETLRLAADLAHEHGARLSVLAVSDALPEIEWLAQFTKSSRGQVEDRLIADQRAWLEAEVARIASDRDVAIDVHIGKPFLEIIRAVLAEGHDLVVKTAEEAEGLHRYLFTSTDQHLLRKCPCPVWLRLPDAPRPTRTVLAAVDVSGATNDGADAEADLNQTILETAARIAAFEAASLHVIHVWDAPGEGLVRRWATEDESVTTYVREIEAQHRQALTALIDAAGVRLGSDLAGRLRLTPQLARGAPRSVIPARADALGVDLIVMGTIARTGVPGLIIGNTAEDVLNAIECSVVTVKPPGYVSPVAS
ncbi:MAG: universal stress protein [Pseudomonadota bacterium]